MTVVFSNPLGATSETWSAQIAIVRDATTYEHPAATTVDELGEHVLGLVDGPFAFCGLSMGGLVGMWLATRAPERVERLVLACTAPRFAPPERWSERAAVVRERGLEAIVDSVLDRWFTRAADPALVRRFRAMFLSTPPETYARQCEAVRDADFRDDLARIEAPTLVIAGADDPAVSTEDVALLASIPNAHVVTTPGAHLANAEHPQEFNRALAEHLA